MTFRTRVRNAECEGVLRRREAHGVVAHGRTDTDHRFRHVTFDARTAAAARGMPGMAGERLRDAAVAARADRIAFGSKLRIAIDVGFVRIGVTVRTGGPPAEKALTLPEPDRIVRETPRPAINPEARILRRTRRMLEHRHEEIVVVGPGAKSRSDSVAERVALRADHAAALGIDASCPDNQARRDRWRLHAAGVV